MSAPAGRQPAERVIVALDFDERDQVLRLLDELGDSISFYKVGLQLYISMGYNIIQLLQDRGKKIFLDLKLHDIPNTVAAACRRLAGYGVAMTNVHALGGSDMMKAAATAVGGSGLDLIAVTVLTSHSADTLRRELHIDMEPAQAVASLAGLAREAGLKGVVCSPREVETVRSCCGNDFLVVTPGVRPSWAGADDQKRIMTPADAVRGGVDYMVIGRPITGAERPGEAADRIIDEISRA